MSKLLVNAYLRQLDMIKKTSGSTRETVVREAFKDLLKNWGKQHRLTFAPEYPLKTVHGTNISVDGALLHELRMPLGYWEAKDIHDDLDAEIARKFRRGYPQDNIVFSNDVEASLWQKKKEVYRCPVTDTAALSDLLERFFTFERPEVETFRTAVEQFKVDLPAVLAALRKMIENALIQNKEFRTAADEFLLHAQEVINPALSEADVREMLIQHVLTEDIFSKVFDSDFHRENNVAKKLYALENEFFTGALKKNTLKALEPYYAAIRSSAAQIASHHEKQNFLKVIYENFYKVYNVKAADRLGVVYTPNEVVRFMVDATDWLCEEKFGRNLIDKDVHILDPATGTGTFICELLEHFRGQTQKLQYKYRNELHANEVAILPYYVANLNIEATYSGIVGEYEQFENLCFVDTLDNVGLHTAAHGVNADLFAGVSAENVERIRRQNSRRISVVIGNPPYNANQQNENHANKNRSYPAIDKRIKATYVDASTAQKTKLYDMYARFFRWASDRLSGNGIVAFVSNNSFVDSKTFDGFRKLLSEEFNEVWIIDLKGNARTTAERRRREGGNVFENKIMVGIAVWFCVKKDGAKGCKINYEAVADFARADEKIDFLTAKPIWEREFERIQPDKKNNWINLTQNDFDDLLPLASKETKAADSPSRERAILKFFTNGVNTARDEWVYARDADDLEPRINHMVKVYGSEVKRRRKDEEIDVAQLSPTIKWSAGLLGRLARGQKAPAFDKGKVVPAVYRPFTRLHYYADQFFSDRLTASHAECFGEGYDAGDGQFFALTAPAAARNFSALAIATLADWHFLGDTVIFPLRRMKDGQIADNVTDWGINKFVAHYKKSAPQPSAKRQRKITKDNVFHYCYAVLHDPVYRGTYAKNLNRDLPRIPLYPDFFRWADWGLKLMELHSGYLEVQPFNVQRLDQPDKYARAAGQPPKVLLRSHADKGEIAIDSETILAGIPMAAWRYLLGHQSALDWVLEQSKDKKSTHDTFRQKFAEYSFADVKEDVIDLLCRVVAVSTETVRITEEMRLAER